MRYVRTHEGFVVDAETGEVVDIDNIDYQHPEYRVFEPEDVGKVHYEPMERVDPLESVLSIGDLPPSLSIARRPCRELERKALEVGGVKALAVFKCLRNMGADPYAALYAIEKAVVSNEKGSGKWVSLAYRVSHILDHAERDALIRWIARPDRPVNLRHAAMVFGADIRKSRGGSIVLIRCNDLGIQIMKTKIDISARLSQYELLAKAVEELEKRLGIKFMKLEPAVATVVLKPPFKVDLRIASLLGSQLVGRVKISRRFWTAIVFRHTVNIYVDLHGDTSRIRLAVADCLPLVCLCAKR